MTEAASDKELLERAAKAAGIKVLHRHEANLYWMIEFHERGMKGWNPLLDDGDALRLAVKLGIAIYPPECEDDDPTVNTPGDTGRWITEPRADDPYAATRRAIVRAAASIGEAS